MSTRRRKFGNFSTSARSYPHRHGDETIERGRHEIPPWRRRVSESRGVCDLPSARTETLTRGLWSTRPALSTWVGSGGRSASTGVPRGPIDATGHSTARKRGVPFHPRRRCCVGVRSARTDRPVGVRSAGAHDVGFDGVVGCPYRSARAQSPRWHDRRRSTGVADGTAHRAFARCCAPTRRLGTADRTTTRRSGTADRTTARRSVRAEHTPTPNGIRIQPMLKGLGEGTREGQRGSGSVAAWRQ